MSDMLEEMKKYFDETPKDKIKSDWDKLDYLDKVGPTVDVFLNNMLDITKEEILLLDTRIKSILLENPEFSDDEYYVKIWFNYKLNDKFRTDGKHEFSALTKEQLFKDVKHFLNTDNNFFKIL